MSPVALSTRSLWIVSPCYFDTRSFQQLYNEALATLSPLAFRQIRFVLVDDSAGRDLEIETIRNLKGLSLLRAPFNLGHQKAIVFGLRNLSQWADDEDFVVTMDSDGEDQPKDLAQMIERLQQFPSDVVLAQRTHRSEGLKFRILYKLYKLFFRTLTGRTVQSGNFAAFSVRILRTMIHHPHFDRCYSMSLFSTRTAVQFVPLARGKRFFGESRMNTMSLVRHGLNMLMPFLDQISFRGMLLLFFTSLVGISAALAIVYIKLFTELAIPGWASYALLGVLTLSAGAFGNLLVLFFMYTQIDSHYLMNLVTPNRQPEGD